MQTSKRGFVANLKKSGRTSVPAAHRRISGALVAGEIAVSLTLLVGAGLLLKSFWLLVHVNPGFRTEHVVTARLSLGGPAYRDPASRVRFWQELQEGVSYLPGVKAVGATSYLPLSGWIMDNPFHLPGRSYGPSEFDDALFRSVTTGYLPAMGVPLMSGRWLDQHDVAGSPGVMLVNQAFAKRYFEGHNAVGKAVELMADQPSREIVGVVGNVSNIALSDAQQPEMYVPYAQYAPFTMNLVVRGRRPRGIWPRRCAPR